MYPYPASIDWLETLAVLRNVWANRSNPSVIDKPKAIHAAWALAGYAASQIAPDTQALSLPLTDADIHAMLASDPANQLNFDFLKWLTLAKKIIDLVTGL